jgi:predicted small secreted protein
MLSAQAQPDAMDVQSIDRQTIASISDMPTSSRTPRGVAAIVLASALTLAACGHSPKKPVGPDVRGLDLVDAEHKLRAAQVGFTEHAEDALFGILIKSNFVVCREAYVGPHMVRLEVAKHGC